MLRRTHLLHYHIRFGVPRSFTWFHSQTALINKLRSPSFFVTLSLSLSHRVPDGRFHTVLKTRYSITISGEKRSQCNSWKNNFFEVEYVNKNLFSTVAGYSFPLIVADSLRNVDKQIFNFLLPAMIVFSNMCKNVFYFYQVVIPFPTAYFSVVSIAALRIAY